MKRADPPTGGLTILKGSLAPEGAVVKSAGFDSEVFEGTARVFDGERAAMDAVEQGSLQGGRRRRHPLRGAQGRPGHARDARRHRRDQGRRARQGRAAAHRRPVLRRHDRPVRRPRRAGGRRRRPDRVRAGRRPHPRSTSPRGTLDLRRRRRRAGPPRGGLHAARAEVPHAASWPSTASSSAAPPAAPSAADRRRRRGRRRPGPERPGHRPVAASDRADSDVRMARRAGAG